MSSVMQWTHLLLAAAVAFAAILALLRHSSNMYPQMQSIRPLLNRSGCEVVDFEEHRAAFDAINRAIDHADYMQLSDRVLSSIDPVELVDVHLSPVETTFLGAKIEITTNLRSLRVSGLPTLVPLHVNVTSPSSLKLGWRSTGVVAVQAEVGIIAHQRDKRWWQPCWISPWHPSSCPPRVVTVEVLAAASDSSGMVKAQVDMFKCPSRGEEDGGCQDMTAWDLMRAVLRGQPSEFLLRLFNRVESLNVRDLELELGKVEQLHVGIPGANRFTKASVSAATEWLERALNRKGAVYRALVDGIKDALVAAANRSVARWIAPLFHGSCLEEEDDAA